MQNKLEYFLAQAETIRATLDDLIAEIQLEIMGCEVNKMLDNTAAYASAAAADDAAYAAAWERRFTYKYEDELLRDEA